MAKTVHKFPAFHRAKIIVDPTFAFSFRPNLSSTMMLRTTTHRALRPLHRNLAFARLYHEKVIDHYERPRNVGSLPKNDINVGTGLYVPHFITSIFLGFGIILIHVL